VQEEVQPRRRVYRRRPAVITEPQFSHALVGGASVRYASSARELVKPSTPFFSLTSHPSCVLLFALSEAT
jgi:hypothetical protein